MIVPREITDVRQLAGKRVSFDVKGSGTDYTGRAMFEGLGVAVEAVNVDQPTAFDLLKKGELAAVVSVAAKPVAVVAGFDGLSDRFHFVTVPYVDALADRYYPATLTAADYPKLVRAGETVNTMAVGTVLGAYNWPEKTERYTRVARFVDAFFSKFERFLQAPRHPKWQEVNLAATVPGWTRFRPAQEWLDRHDAPASSAEVGQVGNFQRFLEERRPAADSDRDGLFDAFRKWQGARRS